MISKPIAWMRLVLPRFDYAVVFGMVVLSVEALRLALLLGYGSVDESWFARVRFAIHFIAALSYGVFRAVGFHPNANEDYRRWLESTPWTSRLPLPAGPITLVLQDLVVILLLLGLSQDFSLKALYIPVIFLTSYQATLAFINWELDEWALAYGVGFGLGAQCFFFRQPELQLAIGAACYPLTWFAVERSLRRFPWEKSQEYEQLKSNLKETLNSRPALNSLGWPYDALAPTPPSDVICRHDAICLACLIGWWYLAVLWGSDRDARLPLLLLPKMLFVLAPMFRIGLYVQGYRSPIDLWGRIRTGRLIIPRYDSIWVASLVAWLVVIPLYWEAVAAGLGFSGLFFSHSMTSIDPRSGLESWEMNLIPLAMTLMLLALFLIGPGLKRWRLVGKHRIVFAQARKEFIEL